MIRLLITDIRMSETLQPRMAINDATVIEYAERMTEGDQFPPVIVFYDGADHWLADGYHRVHAAGQANQTHIAATIKRGTFDDARWFSYSANLTHGQRRTRGDAMRTVDAALKHPNAATMSDQAIAGHCGVSRETVRKRRSILQSLQDEPTRQVTRNGTTYTQDTSNIGKKKKQPPPVEPPEPAPVQSLTEQGLYTLEAWQALPVQDRRLIIKDALSSTTKKRFNDQTSDNIEWARWSWNPITGCYHDCIYCYARDIAARYYAQGFDATFIPDRLAIPLVQTPPEDADHLIGYRNVFTCSMADLFGKWVPEDWIHAVLTVVRDSPQWNFLFLTKFPIRLSEQTWPDNAWVGCTVDRQARVSSAERAFSKVKAGIKWLSCEPLLEPLKFSSLEMFDWVVIGGQSRSTQAPEFQPPWEWIESLVEQARAAGCQVYFKTNLHARPREYPMEVKV